MPDYTGFTMAQLAGERERLIQEAQGLKVKAEELGARDTSLATTMLVTRLHQERSALYKQVQDVNYEIYKLEHAAD